MFTWHPPNPDLAIRQRGMILHSTEHISTAPESSGGVLYTTPSNTSLQKMIFLLSIFVLFSSINIKKKIKMNLLYK